VSPLPDWRSAQVPGLDIVERVAEFVELREDEFVAPVLRRAGVDVFELLVAVMLTQNTSDRNAFRAYHNLKRAVGRITPQALLSLGEDRLAELIRPAGMHRRQGQEVGGALEGALRRRFVQIGADGRGGG